MSELPDVRPGQIWADNDKRIPRSNQRYLRVQSVSDPYAVVERVIQLDTGQWVSDEARTRATTHIRIARFRPNSTGYRLVKDVPR